MHRPFPPALNRHKKGESAMPEYFLGLLFFLLTILFLVRSFISAKKKVVYLTFAAVSLLAGILIFAFYNWHLSEKNDDVADNPPIHSGGEEPQNGTGKDPEDNEEPGDNDEVEKPEPKEPEKPKLKEIIVPDDEVVHYVVEKGDTLFNISQRSGIPAEKIKQWNQLSGDTIYIGQVLILYGKNKEPAPQQPKPEEPGNYGPSKIIVRGNPNAKKIALTFDAGSDIAGIRILDVLKEHNVKATFFLTGKWVEKFPSYAKRIAAEGHEIANHSHSHPDAVKTDSSVFYEDIKKAERIIEETTGVSPRPYFRFPYGSYNKDALETVGKAGYPYSIHWTIDTLDWQQPAADVIAQRILDKAQNGAIVLMHIGGINTPDGVDQVIPELKKRGYQIVTLSEVLK